MSALAAFHPAVQRWFADRLGEPTAPQRQGWPLIREGRNVLIAAPTGSGKTLAAFLSAIDSLLQRGSELADETHVLYVSPLRALPIAHFCNKICQLLTHAPQHFFCVTRDCYIVRCA